MGYILMEQINFIYEYEKDGVIFPNGLTEDAYHSTLEQIELQGVSTNDFFTRGYTDHHMVINLSSRYPEKTFNVFYTRTIYENILHFFTKINDKKYYFDKNDRTFEINLIKPNEIKPNQNNYYAINLFGNEDFLFQTPSISVTNLVETQSPNKPLLNINPVLIDAIRKGDLKLIIATFHEGGVHYPSFFEKLYDSCRKLGINPTNIHYVNADFNVNLQHELYCNSNFVFKKINLHFVDWLFTTACGAYSNNPYDEDVLNYEGPREKNFLIFNRSVFKDHRFWYLSQLKKSGVLDDCLYSMIFPYDREIQFGQDIYRGFPAFTNEEEFNKLLPYMQQVKDTGVVKIDDVDTFEDTTFFANGKRVHYGWIDWSKPTFDFTFLRTYMTLLTESSFTSCQVSEKGVKALRYYHPFIAVAGPLYLEMLKEKGFRTFDKYFDESYDKIFNHKDRMNAVSKLTAELNDSKKLHKIFMDSKEDVIYNSHLCRTFSDRQTIQELFYNIFEK
jgi:hypothetical protein